MKIKTLLIANRGEIAIRICNTAKKLNIKTYVIKTSKETNATYLKHGDEIIDFSENFDEIPDFLDVDKIISITKKYNIDAIHPGYGFLSENPYFAQRCEDEKIIFIGPTAEAIYKMGNKTIAKQLAIKHNVPLLEGSKGNVSDTNIAKKIANKIGYPVILKAASGGGGRGMRIVHQEKDIDKNFKLATNEAAKAFNDPSVFIESYCSNPRHIEFQILGDKHGNIVHLGERECSIQRKHQKLIEEAPSAALTDELREKMGKAAINIAKAVKYNSAGTVEFLLDEDNNFFFMEMNTRIQVEHPVTEMITGIDLIEQQIRIAEGEKLSITQKDIQLNGWAIECRINAEDVQNNFAPFLGTIENIFLPKLKNVRFDSGVQPGSQVTPYFDSMIIKLIAWGENRNKAISNVLAALNKIRIKGLKTTIPFCKAVMHNKDFQNGTFDTSFIESKLENLTYKESEEELMAAFFVTMDYINERKADEEVQMDYEKGKTLTPWLINKRLKTS